MVDCQRDTEYGTADAPSADVDALAAPAERPASAPVPCPKARSAGPVALPKELIDNLPYLGMMLLGSAIFPAGLRGSPWGWALAGLYFAYGVAGAFWIMLFLCPYCHFYDTRLCPCGYGRIAAKLRPRKDTSLFARQFRRHIPVIVPLWIIPVVVAGGVLAIGRFGWVLLVLLIAFIVVSFVVLPLVSTRYGCASCPQRDMCPWMERRRARS